MQEPIESRAAVDPTTASHTPQAEAGVWCLGPHDLAATAADAPLMRRLAAGQDPDETEPTGAIAAAWLREVRAGGDVR